MAAGASHRIIGLEENAEAWDGQRGREFDRDEYRPLLTCKGLTLVEHRLRDRKCGDATVWLARASLKGGSEPAAASPPGHVPI